MTSTFAKVIDSFRTTTLGRGAGGTSLPLAGGAGAALGSLPAGRIFRVTAVLNPDTDNEQIVTVLEATGLSGNTLTGITVSPGYSDANLVSGTFIDIRVCARDISELQDAVNAVEAAVGSGTGGGITALTGDVTATGPGSAPATLKTVNANVGTFTLATIAVDAKGRITGASNGTAGSGGAVSSVFTRTGVVTAQAGDYTVSQVTGAAPLASPHFTGTPTGLKQPFGFGAFGPIKTGQKTPTHYVDVAMTAYGLEITASAGTVTAQIEKSINGGSTWTVVDSITLSSGLSNTKVISAALTAGTLLRVNYTAVSSCTDPNVAVLAVTT